MNRLKRNILFALSTALLLTISAVVMLNITLLVVKANSHRNRKRKFIAKQCVRPYFCKAKLIAAEIVNLASQGFYSNLTLLMKVLKK